MNAQTAKTQFSFQLPSMSYVDAGWEEPELRTPPTARQSARRHGVASWLAGRMAEFRMWRQEQRMKAELEGMTDRELLDIGLNRGDVGRVFIDAHNADLRSRGPRG